MANYSLILDTKFNPFSYQEMLAPVAAATQAHQAIEEEYGNLSAKASVWKNMANEQSDPYAYKMYKGYADDLEARAEDLMRYGLNASSRKGMLDMRTRYNKEILPIETAYKRREVLAEEQRKAMAANPTMLYQRYARNMSLDDFIKNPSLDYGNQYSGALLTQQVSQAAANIAKEARDSEEGKRKLRKLLPYQYELVQQNGFSRDAVMKAILNSPDADSILTGLVESAIGTSGVKNWGDADTVRRAYDYARQGLYNAIGATQYQVVADQFGMQSALQAQAHRHRMAEQRAAQQAAAQRAAKGKMWAFKDSKLQGGKGPNTGKWSNFRKSGFITKDGDLSTRGLKNAKLGNKITNYIWQAEHAKTQADRLKYATLAYRAAYGKNPTGKAPSSVRNAPVRGGIGGDVSIMSDYMNPNMGSVTNILNSAKASNQYKFYTSLRGIGVSKATLSRNTNTLPAHDLSLVNNAYQINMGNPVVGQLTHTLSDEAGKQLISAIASELNNQKAMNVMINPDGTVSQGSKGTNLLSLNKPGETKVFVKHFSLVPSSPGTAILTLNTGKKVMLSRKQMNQVFGESVTNSLISNSNLYVHGNHNESTLGLANINELMGTATTMWSNPSAEGTGMVDYTYDYGDE